MANTSSVKGCTIYLTVTNVLQERRNIWIAALFTTSNLRFLKADDVSIFKLEKEKIYSKSTEKVGFSFLGWGWGREKRKMKLQKNKTVKLTNLKQLQRNS